MDLQSRKYHLIERIFNIEKESVLEAIESIFDKTQEQESLVPESHYRQLMKDREDYRSGKLKGSSFEEVKARFKEKYGV